MPHTDILPSTPSHVQENQELPHRVLERSPIWMRHFFGSHRFPTARFQARQVYGQIQYPMLLYGGPDAPIDRLLGTGSPGGFRFGGRVVRPPIVVLATTRVVSHIETSLCCSVAGFRIEPRADECPDFWGGPPKAQPSDPLNPLNSGWPCSFKTRRRWAPRVVEGAAVRTK